MNFQNILLITCKNEAGKPHKQRGSEGYRRNEESPKKGIITPLSLPKVHHSRVEMKKARRRALLHYMPLSCDYLPEKTL